jgi:hypothetical protein
VDPDGIRSVGGAGGEHTGQRLVGVIPGMDREERPVRLVEPGENQDVLTDGKPVESGRKAGLISNRAQGAPSYPCLGAWAARFKAECTRPIGCTS